ncbi:MAG: GNAT family N-acetyltransferase [Actinomycetota bacterium]|nr:GNAT family N-acetyltransferase [Actinomycetota bacterium]
MALEVRPVRPGEMDEAGRVTAAAYRELAPEGHASWERYLQRLADVRGRARTTTVLVAVEDGRVLASATLELTGRVPGGYDRPPLDPDEAHLRMLGVHPSARRRGIGRQMVEACMRLARRSGKSRLTLDTTGEMVAARAMYEAMGFLRGPDQVYPDGFRLLWYERSLHDVVPSPRDRP